MSSQLNFNKKLPSEIQRREKMPKKSEVAKIYSNATVTFDGKHYYVTWAANGLVTKAALDAKYIGTGRIWIGKSEKTLKPSTDSWQSYQIYAAFNKVIHSNAGSVWWSLEAKKAETAWKAVQVGKIAA